MNHVHVGVWIDHGEARIFHIGPTGVEEATVHASSAAPDASTVNADRGMHADRERFIRDVAREIEGARAILVVGPSSAKLDLVKQLEREGRGGEPRVVGVDLVDHATDAEIVVSARRYFRRTAAVRPMFAS